MILSLNAIDNIVLVVMVNIAEDVVGKAKVDPNVKHHPGHEPVVGAAKGLVLVHKIRSLGMTRKKSNMWKNMLDRQIKQSSDVSKIFLTELMSMPGASKRVFDAGPMPIMSVTSKPSMSQASAKSLNLSDSESSVEMAIFSKPH